MNGQTIIQYGDVALFHCQTRRVDQTAVLDSAGVSLSHWRYMIHVTGYLNGAVNTSSPLFSATEPPAAANIGGRPYIATSVSGSVFDSAGAASGHRSMRWQLAPRQSFTMATGCTGADVRTGSILLQAISLEGVSQSDLSDPADPSRPAGPKIGLTGRDVNDGPYCRQFVVTQVSGNNVYRVEAIFEIAKVQCDSNDNAFGNTLGVLAHRWACVDSIDVNLRVTRTYHGVLEIASSQWSPHIFRSLVVPPLQAKMRRQHMEFLASEDGKKLVYSVTDVDVAIAAPKPARTWHVDHTITSLKSDALKITEQISVVLTGDHDVDKSQLITLGLYIITAKLRDEPPPIVGADPLAPGGLHWGDLTITDHTGDVNAVTLSASCWRHARIAQLDNGHGQRVDIALASRFKAFRVLENNDLPQFSSPYDPDFSFSTIPEDGIDGPNYDAPCSLIGIFRCYLQVPCDNLHSVDDDGDNMIENEDGENPSEPDDSIASYRAAVATSVPDEIPEYYSESQQANAYTYYEIESKYVTDSLRVAMPVALPLGGGSPDVRTATVFPRIGASQSRRYMKIAAERIGDWPEFPDPETVDGQVATTYTNPLPPISQSLLKSKLLSHGLAMSINGEELYTARWQAVFGLSRAPTPFDMLKIGVHKWANNGNTATTPTLTASLQQDSVVGDNVPRPSGSGYYQE